MHPILQDIATALERSQDDPALPYQFGLACVEEVSTHLEDEAAIRALQQFRQLLCPFNAASLQALPALADALRGIAQSHPGSTSIDGTRHAAVSASYALLKAVEGQALQAAAYAAYSSLYGYGGYAVNDHDAFAEVHRRQLGYLQDLQQLQARTR